MTNTNQTNRRCAYVDIETCSRVNLLKYGVFRYVEDAYFDIICATALFDDPNQESVLFWHPIMINFSAVECGLKLFDFIDVQNCKITTSLREFYDQIKRQSDIIVAHNAEFERVCLMQRLEAFAEFNWECTMTKAVAANLPKSLKNLSHFYHGKAKMESGHDLISRYSCIPPDKQKLPCIPSDDAVAFIQYNYRDTELVKDLNRVLIDPNDREDYAMITSYMNARGIPVNVETARDVLATVAREKSAIETTLPINVRSPKQMTEYCQQRGIKLQSTNKATIHNLLKDDNLSDEVKKVLEARQLLSLSSTGKYKKILECENQGRVQNCFSYYGTVTGRDAGRNIQPQNFPKGSYNAAKWLNHIAEPSYPLLTGLNVFQGAKNGLRGVIQAPPGKTFFCADFSCIEFRVLMWLCNQQNALKYIREGDDFYKVFAAKIYQTTIDKIDTKQRKVGKAAVLGLGYGMGVARFIFTCKQNQIEMNEKLARHVHINYREMFHHVTLFWYECQGALEKLIVSTLKTTSIRVGKVIFHKFREKFYGIELPSGRRIIYFHVHKMKGRIYYCKYRHMKETDKPEYFVRINEQWFFKDDLYGGKLVEHITQATARDIFFNACYELENDNPGQFNIVARIHDEVLAEIEDCEVDKQVQDGIQIMQSHVESWAETIPLKVEAWHGHFYHK